MRLVQIALIGALTAGLANPSAAQAQANVDVDKLPLSLKRVQNQLKKLAEQPDVGPLHLHYYVDVFGQPPPIELFTKEDNLTTGPVPYGGPTHSQMLHVMTPQEYRTPVMDFTAIARWLADRLNKKPETK
jgi:hypothetical protein